MTAKHNAYYLTTTILQLSRRKWKNVFLEKDLLCILLLLFQSLPKKKTLKMSRDW